MTPITRRDFSAALLGSGAALGWASSPALAQGQPVEGTHYVALGQPVATAAPGKVEVIEFFWYGCPHCNVFEPMLDAWVKKLPADVAFRRVPVAFRDEPYGTHQRIFYALEATGQLDAMHKRAGGRDGRCQLARTAADVEDPFAVHRLEQRNQIRAAFG